MAFPTGFRLRDTARRAVVDLVVREEGRVSMYVCGPTVYAPAHLGHARSYVVYDALRRALAGAGLEVKLVVNFTDMEESIARRAAEEGVPPFDLAERYAALFIEDMAALRILPADAYPRASAWVPRMIEIVERLVESGAAYLVDCRAGAGTSPDACDVYFDAAKAPRFGHLVGQPLEAIAADRPAPGERRSPADFALWKSRADWGVTWTSPWGEGRPGWHLECVAMATGLLGAPFDLHGGGLDLVFPHHESESAIAESLDGGPYCGHWMHNGFVTVDAAKMSKSRGNYVTVREALARHSGAALRAFLLATHYPAPLEYDEAAVGRWEGVLARAAALRHRLAERAAGAAARPALEKEAAAFDAALRDDLRTDLALATFAEAVEAAADLDGGEAAGALAAIDRMGEVLGVL